jgi:hypothetical protein
MNDTKETQPRESDGAQLKSLVEQGRYSEVLAILDAAAMEHPLELWQLVLRSRSIQLDETATFPFNLASQPLEEALEREPDYLPALLDLGHFLNLHTDETERAVETYVQATEIVMEHLLDALRGWGSSKDLEDEARRDILTTYNQLVDKLHFHGLDAGERARRVDWMDPEQFGEEEL